MGDTRVIAPSQSTLRCMTSLTDLDEEFASAIQDVHVLKVVWIGGLGVQC